MAEQSSPLTALLLQWRGGDGEALNALTPLVYDNLRRIAARHLAREPAGVTLCATEVVHEAYQKLIGVDIPWQDRAHFLAVASRQMRQVLVDHARTKKRQKRGGEQRQQVTLGDVQAAAGSEQVDILSIETALERLAAIDPRKATVVDLMAFGGLKGRDVAEVLGISEEAVWREWKMARAFLHQQLKSITPDGL